MWSLICIALPPLGRHDGKLKVLSKWAMAGAQPHRVFLARAISASRRRRQPTDEGAVRGTPSPARPRPPATRTSALRPAPTSPLRPRANPRPAAGRCGPRQPWLAFSVDPCFFPTLPIAASAPPGCRRRRDGPPCLCCPARPARRARRAAVSDGADAVAAAAAAPRQRARDRRRRQPDRLGGCRREQQRRGRPVGGWSRRGSAGVAGGCPCCGRSGRGGGCWAGRPRCHGPRRGARCTRGSDRRPWLDRGKQDVA